MVQPSHMLESPLKKGIILAIFAFLSDVGFKTYMLHIFDIAHKGLVKVTPFFDLVMAWNYGISYGLFQQDSMMGRYALISIKLAIILFLIHWLWRNIRLYAAIGLGLIIGGAVGNVFDRLVYGAVADFFSFYIGTFRWYIFNLADVWIVIGVIILGWDHILEMKEEKISKS